MIQIQFNSDFLEFKKGQTVSVQCDSEGTPIEKRFRKILKDSEIDNCVSIVKPEEQIIKPEKLKSERKPK